MNVAYRKANDRFDYIIMLLVIIASKLTDLFCPFLLKIFFRNKNNILVCLGVATKVPHQGRNTQCNVRLSQSNLIGNIDNVILRLMQEIKTLPDNFYLPFSNYR